MKNILMKDDFLATACWISQVASNGAGNSSLGIFEVHADNNIGSNYLYLYNLPDTFQTIFIVHIIIRDLCVCFVVMKYYERNKVFGLFIGHTPYFIGPRHFVLLSWKISESMAYLTSNQ